MGRERGGERERGREGERGGRERGEREREREVGGENQVSLHDSIFWINVKPPDLRQNNNNKGEKKKKKKRKKKASVANLYKANKPTAAHKGKHTRSTYPFVQ